jgi:hypothetical protein
LTFGARENLFNSRFYTEKQVLALIDEKYPDSIRKERPPLRKKLKS